LKAAIMKKGMRMQWCYRRVPQWNWIHAAAGLNF
jgi:hypothetical protein